ncbi:MAG: hypothetical protein P9L98_05285 [Candidatus Kaelpia imicola]|nr:hypothetical protein [Candidatus Kaelpia imicola]
MRLYLRFLIIISLFFLSNLNINNSFARRTKTIPNENNPDDKLGSDIDLAQQELREIKQRSGLSIEDFAKELNISVMFMRLYLVGNMAIPDARL